MILPASPTKSRATPESDIMNIMEVSKGRLTATLRAGKIPVTEETLALLRAGLTKIGHGYHIEKCISTWAKSDTELKKDLARLHAACRTVVELLDADLRGSCQIEAILSDFWNGIPIPQLVEQLRPLCLRLETVVAMAAQDGRIKKRPQTPETSFFLAVHDLFSVLKGNPEPGIAGPLHRFTGKCAALIGADIVVPKEENSFQKRLTAALARRTGKIDVFPKIIFPGK